VGIVLRPSYTRAVSDDASSVRTFLIADVRGYSRFTEEFGDEAAAHLAAKFADLVREGVEAHDGDVTEIRGDEALAVFVSARQAIRAAVDLQAQFDEESDAEVPLRVGIGIDSGEAVRLPDGSFRGAALNVAARLCGRAHAGEVLVSEATSRLAGRLAGLHYSDRGRVRLKNIPEPIHVFKVYSELDARPANRWVVMFFGRPARTLGWRVGLLVTLIAATTAAAVVYLTAAGPDGSRASQPGGGGQATPPQPRVATALADVVPRALWRDCKLQTVAEPGALETAVCLPAQGVPDRWEISAFPNGVALDRAYSTELRRQTEVVRDNGACGALFWGGEREWLHGPGKPGGRFFCYFDGDDAIIVWTHGRLAQPTHLDILGIAREGGSDHASLTDWWSPWHHRIGKAN
jgi:class 3 adenylate cyclase